MYYFMTHQSNFALTLYVPTIIYFIFNLHMKRLVLNCVAVFQWSSNFLYIHVAVYEFIHTRLLHILSRGQSNISTNIIIKSTKVPQIYINRYHFIVFALSLYNISFAFDVSIFNPFLCVFFAVYADIYLSRCIIILYILYTIYKP